MRCYNHFLALTLHDRLSECSNLCPIRILKAGLESARIVIHQINGSIVIPLGRTCEDLNVKVGLLLNWSLLFFLLVILFRDFPRMLFSEGLIVHLILLLFLIWLTIILLLRWRRITIIRRWSLLNGVLRNAKLGFLRFWGLWLDCKINLAPYFTCLIN